MKALRYEYLIRGVYGSGRNFKIGAEADLYRQMEVALRGTELNPGNDNLVYQYQSKFAGVRSYVRKALVDGIDRTNSEEQIEIKEMIKKLNFSFYDKEQLDEIIDRATDIFHKHGMTI